MSLIKPMLSVFLAIVAFSAVSNGQGTCSSFVKCTYFDVLGKGMKEWILAFRGTPYVGSKVCCAYQKGTDVPIMNDIGCLQVDPSLPCSHHYRNNVVLDNWQDIAEVAFVVYNQSGLAQYILFNGSGSNYTNWFSADKVKDSSWADLTASSHAYFRSEKYTADDTQKRFYITKDHFGSCRDGYTWLLVDNMYPSGNCSWLASHAYPYVRYAVGDSAALRTSADFAEAALYAVFVKYL